MARFTEFKHKETKRYFEVRPTTNAWAIQNGLPFEIVIRFAHDCTPDITRFATIKKTVVNVAVDENDEGKPVFEKWPVIFSWECWMNMTEMIAEQNTACAA